MAIAGVVVLADNKVIDKVLLNLQQVDNVTTYGIHKSNYIVAVLESDTVENLEEMANHINEKIDGVIGVYPNYINY